MKRTIVFLSIAAMGMLPLAACSDAPAASGYTQSRAIDQDIDATHVVGPTATSPAFTAKNPLQTLTPWRNEETIDTTNRVEQTGQIPQ
jgi:hypothetical protein